MLDLSALTQIKLWDKKTTDLELYERVYKSCYKEDGCLRKLTYSVKWVCVHCRIAMFTVFWTIQNLISNLIFLFHFFSLKGLGFDDVWDLKRLV